MLTGRSEVRSPDVPVSAPAASACTSTEITQVPPAATRPPEKASEVAKAAGAKVPPQVVDASGVPATARPSGKASVKAREPTSKAFAPLSIL